MLSIGSSPYFILTTNFTYIDSLACICDVSCAYDMCRAQSKAYLVRWGLGRYRDLWGLLG